MRKLFLLIGVCCLSAAEIRVDLTQAGKKVSPDLLGYDETSLTEPARVAPVERRLPAVGDKFQYELNGNSFTVLKLAAERLP